MSSGSADYVAMGIVPMALVKQQVVSIIRPAKYGGVGESIQQMGHSISRD